MSIGPEDVERAVFRERFRGYDQDQVDRFLDQVSAALAALTDERDELAAELQTLRGGGHVAAIPSGEGVDALMKRTLTAAQRTAEELVADARRQAAELLEDTRRRVDRDREQVRAEAELVRRAVGELRAFRDEYRGRLHAIMSEQLAALDRAGELPSLPPAVDRLGEAVLPSPAPARREPSPAQAWAAAAAQDDEPVEEEPEGDALTSPWDDLWQPAATQADAPASGESGMEPSFGGSSEGPRGETAPADAGDA